MAKMIIGSNVALDHVANYGAMIDFHRATHPAVMVGMVDNIKDAMKIIQLRDELRGVQIVSRVWHPQEGAYAQKPEGNGDTRPMIASPEDVLNQQAHLGENGLWLNVMNEPSAFLAAADVDKTVDWLVRFVKLAGVARVSCVLPNFADGHPALVNGEWEAAWRPLLEAMAQYPALMKLGAHLYGPDKLTDTLSALNATCKEHSILRPEIVGTEFGLDSTGQGDKANGYHTRGTGRQFVDWMRAVTHGELKPFIVSGQIVGLAVFQWNELWANFNIAKDGDYQQAMKEATANRDFEFPVVYPAAEPVKPKPPVEVLPPPAQETITEMPQLPPVPSVTLKTWAFGFEMVGTEEQKTAIERGLELMVAGMAWIGQAAGTSVTIKAREVTTV